MCGVGFKPSNVNSNPRPLKSEAIIKMGKFRFQVQLAGKWEDYKTDENAIIHRAFMSGNRNAKYCLRGQTYQYDFERMEQKNADTGKVRKIRGPPGLKRPEKPIVTAGPTMMVVVPPQAGPGDIIHVPHPQNKALSLQVVIPQNAVPGSTLLVPVPPAVIANEVPAAPTKTPEAPQDPVPAVDKKDSSASVDAKDQDDGTITKGQAAALVGGIGAAGLAGGIVGAHALGADMGPISCAIDAIGDAADPIIDELGDFAGDVGDFIMDLFN